MSQNDFNTLEHIKKVIKLVVGDALDTVFEIRIPKAESAKTISGYYDIQSIDKAAEAVKGDEIIYMKYIAGQALKGE